MLKGVYVLIPHSLFAKKDQVPAVAKVTALLVAYLLSKVNMIACNK